MAEHDGVGPADPHPSRTERPHARFTPGDHDLVGADRPRLERRPDPLRVGWTAPRSPRTCLPAPPSSGWLRCLHHPPHPSAPGCPYLWPDPVPSAPLVVGVFLIAGAQRPYAGAGAVVAALAVWMAYFWRSNPGPFLWPVVFILAAVLIAYGTRRDVSSPTAWLLLLPRFVVGWAFLDNGQNDYTWAFNGGNFLNWANAAVQRGPIWFLEAPYNEFLS